MCGQLEPGQQIMSINGEDTQLFTKMDVYELVRACEESITMELQEDLDGYALYVLPITRRALGRSLFPPAHIQGVAGRCACGVARLTSITAKMICPLAAEACA